MIFTALTSSVSLFPVRDSPPSMNIRKVKAQAGGYKEVSPGLMYSSASEAPFSFCRFFCFQWVWLMSGCLFSSSVCTYQSPERPGRRPRRYFHLWVLMNLTAESLLCHFSLHFHHRGLTRRRWGEREKK